MVGLFEEHTNQLHTIIMYMCCAGNKSDHCVHFLFNTITTIVNRNSTITLIIIMANIKYAYRQTSMHDTNPQLSLSSKSHAQCKVHPTLLCPLLFLDLWDFFTQVKV